MSTRVVLDCHKSICILIVVFPKYNQNLSVVLKKCSCQQFQNVFFFNRYIILMFVYISHSIYSYMWANKLLLFQISLLKRKTLQSFSNYLAVTVIIIASVGCCTNAFPYQLTCCTYGRYYRHHHVSYNLRKEIHVDELYRVPKWWRDKKLFLKHFEYKISVVHDEKSSQPKFSENRFIFVLFCSVFYEPDQFIFHGAN